MLKTAGLSLEQAPPISVPFRFFLSAPLFGIAAGVLLLIQGESIFLSRWSPATIGLTHLLTLGFLGMVMCGAMLQMLPVIVGSPVPRVALAGGVSHALLIVGTSLLAAAFISGQPLWMLLALTLLVLGFIIFGLAVAIALWRVHTPSPTITGMKLAVAALMVTVMLGALAAVGYSGIIEIGNLSLLTDIHLAWGILGWVGILLISVSLQVVPMFQVTPEYPRLLARLLAPWIFAGLVGWGALRFSLSDRTPIVGMVLVIAGFVLFAMLTLRLQQQRKRRVPDVTLMFWRTAMLVLIGVALLWGAGQLRPAVADSSYYPMLLGVLMILGVGYPVINGMIYKIVPFLSWFHLQNRQIALMRMTVQIPNMKEMVTDRAARRQYFFYLLALLSAALAVFQPAWLARPAGALFVLTNLLLLINLIGAVRRYRDTARQLEVSPPGS